MYLPGLKFIVAFKTFFFLARIFRIKFQWLTCSCCTPSINFCLPHHLLVRCYSWNCDKASSSIGTIPIFFILRFNAWGTLAICRSRGLAPAGNRGGSLQIRMRCCCVQKRYLMKKRLVLPLNVGKGANGDTFIGDSDNHWVVAIVELHPYKRIIYCDSLAWSPPSILVDVINNFTSHMPHNSKI